MAATTCPGCDYNVVVQAVEGIRQDRSLDKLIRDVNSFVARPTDAGSREGM